MTWSNFLPAPTEKYRGSMIAFYFLVLVALVSTIRSLIHIIAADGGANSIAGLAVDVEGGANLIALFAQWGASQLILALFYWLAVLRYRFLTPSCWQWYFSNRFYGSWPVNSSPLKSPPRLRVRSAAISLSRCRYLLSCCLYARNRMLPDPDPGLRAGDANQPEQGMVSHMILRMVQSVSRWTLSFPG
jgi:hypothetical protein